jgi:hypothetical protein
MLHLASITNRHNDLSVTGGGWFGFGKDQYLRMNATLISDNSAACCYASGYGSQLLASNNTTLTCADTDSGENRGDCCYNSQYSNGESCASCETGTDCSVIGTSLATQSLVIGYWRASTTSTDVRPCWFADACMANSNRPANTTVITASNKDCGTTVAVSSSRSSASSDNILFEESDDCNDTSPSTSNASVTQVDTTTYCAEGYKGPCKYY